MNVARWVYVLYEDLIMYAVVQTGGKQYKVSPGDQLHVELLDWAGSENETVSLGSVLLLKDDSGVQIGKPTLENVTVKAKVLGEERGPKVISFKYKRRKNYRKKIGHRQDYMLVEVLPFEGEKKKPKAKKESSATEEEKPKVKKTPAAKKAPAKTDAAAEKKPAAKKKSPSKTPKE